MKIAGPIVLIDDDRDDLDILTAALNGLGIKEDIRTFETCPDALTYLKNTTEKPFLIFCDLNLPGMNGLEFRRIINQNDFLRRKSIPFVFLSTSAVKEQVHEAYELTVQGFFVKNFSIKDLQASLGCAITYWSTCVHPNRIH